MKPYTVATVAERWGCSETFVYTIVATGELPSFRLGGKLIRIRHDDVEAYEQRDMSETPEHTTASESPSHSELLKHTAPSSDSVRHIARMIRLGQ